VSAGKAQLTIYLLKNSTTAKKDVALFKMARDKKSKGAAKK